MSDRDPPSYAAYLSRFKTAPCAVPLCPERDCWDYHSARDRRRVPQFDPETGFNYGTDICENLVCNYPWCKLAHSRLEVAFHPLLYKTKLCTGVVTLGKCSDNGAHCWLLHSGEAERRPETMHVSSSADVSSESLFKMYQRQGALEVQLKRLTEAVARKKATLACGKCGVRQKNTVNLACGHCVCDRCAAEECACGGGGEWLRLVSHSDN